MKALAIVLAIIGIVVSVWKGLLPIIFSFRGFGVEVPRILWGLPRNIQVLIFWSWGPALFLLSIFLLTLLIRSKA
jgi:hypothetical protein